MLWSGDCLTVRFHAEIFSLWFKGVAKEELSFFTNGSSCDFMLDHEFCFLTQNTKLMCLLGNCMLHFGYSFSFSMESNPETEPLVRTKRPPIYKHEHIHEPQSMSTDFLISSFLLFQNLKQILLVVLVVNCQYKIIFIERKLGETITKLLH